MNKNGIQEAPACDEVKKIRIIIYALSAGFVLWVFIALLLMILTLDIA